MTLGVYSHPYGEFVEGSGKLHHIFGVAKGVFRNELRCPFWRISPESKNVFNAQAGIIAEDGLELFLALADAGKVRHRGQGRFLFDTFYYVPGVF